MDKSKVIEMISKMSALTKDSGAFQGEISNASAKIQELMDKYSITWAEIHSVEADKQSKEYEMAFTSKPSDYSFKKVQAWHWRLAKLIAKVTHTRHYLSGGTIMMFFGTTENCQIAAMLYTLWVTNIKAMSEQATKAHRLKMLRDFPHRPNFFATLPPEFQLKYYRNSWIAGCLDGMFSNVVVQENSRDVQTSNAIVLFTKEIDRHYKDFKEAYNFQSVHVKGMSAKSNTGYEAGVRTGKNISIGAKPIVSGKKLLGG